MWQTNPQVPGVVLKGIFLPGANILKTASNSRNRHLGIFVNSIREHTTGSSSSPATHQWKQCPDGKAETNSQASSKLARPGFGNGQENKYLMPSKNVQKTQIWWSKKQNKEIQRDSKSETARNKTNRSNNRNFHKIATLLIQDSQWRIVLGHFQRTTNTKNNKTTFLNSGSNILKQL